MAIYYVSTQGSDGNAGTTPGTAFLTIQHAHDQTAPGDTVYILPGIYGGGNGGGSIVNISTSGSLAGGYITYSGYPGLSMPILASPVASSDPIQFGIPAGTFLGGTPISYIVIQNMEIVGQNGALTLTGAWANASLGASSGNSTTYNSAGIGSSGIGANRATLTTNNVSTSTTLSFSGNPTTMGVVVGDVVFDLTNTSRITQGTTVTAVGSSTVTLSQAAVSVQSGDTIRFVHSLHHIKILNCIIHDFSAAAIAIDYSDYVTVQGNIVYNNAWYSPSGGSGVSLYSNVDIDTNTSTYKNQVLGNVCFNNRQLIASMLLTQITMAASGTSSSTTLTLSTNPTSAGVTVGMQVFDNTSATRIVAGTTVTAVGTSTVTLSQAANATQNGDAIYFAAYTDGEGIIIDDSDGDQLGQAPYAGKCLVSNNLCVNNGSAGVEAYNSKNVDMTFNTCYLNQTTPTMNTQGELSWNGASGVNGGHGFNNIVQASGTALLIRDGSSGTVTYGYNLGFGGNGTALPGSNNLTGDPLFVAPSTLPVVPTPGYTSVGSIAPLFALQPGSPAIDAATGTYTRTADILGVASPVGPAADMGCVESYASPYGANPLTTVSALMTLFASGGNANITAADVRILISTLAAGRTPWA